MNTNQRERATLLLLQSTSSLCQDLQDNFNKIMIKNLIATKTGHASVSGPLQPGEGWGMGGGECRHGSWYGCRLQGLGHLASPHSASHLEFLQAQRAILTGFSGSGGGGNSSH